MTLPGPVAFVLLLAKIPTVPPVGAPAVNVTIPVSGVPPTTEDADNVRALSAVAPAATCSRTVRNPKYLFRNPGRFLPRTETRTYQAPLRVYQEPPRSIRYC